MLLNPKVKHALNAKISQKLSAVLAAAVIILLAASCWRWEFIMLAIIDLATIIFINRDFYAFFLRKKGWWFTLRVFPMHLLYFLYSTAAFAFSWINFKTLGRTVIVR